jgi:lipopolysaccharide transport system permease protein
MTTEPQTISPTQDESWDMTIEPQRSLFDLRLGELWRYRDRVMLFVRRDNKAMNDLRK